MNKRADRYIAMLNKADKIYRKEYSIGEYCHKQSFKWGFQEGYEQAEKDIIFLLESRIKEIIGDAQPNPVLRIELQGIIDKIK